MSAVLTNPTAIVNDALVRIGYKRRIGNLYEGSEASKLALDIYGQTRDEMLRTGNWLFARRDLVMTLLKSAPAAGYLPPVVWSDAYPPLPWKFEYVYPDDCLKVRSIRPQPIFLANYDPKAVNYSLANDVSYTPAKKVILCNVPAPAYLVYTAQVTDPATWEVSFTESLCASLGRRLAPALANLQTAQAEAGDEKVETEMAAETRG